LMAVVGRLNPGKGRNFRMPIYQYLEKKTGKKVEIVRTISEHGVLPLAEECPELSPEEYAAAEWEQQISGGQFMVRGAGWRGGKGYW
jgi:predicted nucleic acid-binding Zn ribbon protein